MNGLQSFFLFCAGTNLSILKRAPSDSNKMAGIGATIFFTGVFASIAGGFALYSVFHSYILATVFGLLWGLMIFNLDRFIVMSMKKKDNKWKEFGMAFPRIVLAVLIAFVIAKPLELKLFQSEINSELTLMEQEKYKSQEDALKLRFDDDINQTKLAIASLEEQIANKMRKRDALVQEAIAEADGTGGSKQRNLGPIYATKKKAADKAEVELIALQADLNPDIEVKKAQLVDLEANRASNLEAMKRSSLNGFAAQLDALGRLGDKSRTIFWASIFITLLFIAIETAPLFTKLISDRSPYDYKYDMHEQEFSKVHTIKSSLNKANVMSHSEYISEVEKYERQMRTGAEKTIIKDVIDKEVEKLKGQNLGWNGYKASKRMFS